MADKTKIEWCDATWNVITGCSIESPACTNCYAMRLAGTRLREHPSRKGLTKIVNGNPVWTGEVRFNEQWLMQPIQWKKPRRIFVCAHADLFHPNVPDEWINRVFAVMALAPQHTFMVLTKRPKRMREYFNHTRGAIVCAAALSMIPAREMERAPAWNMRWPFPHVMLGVTAEDQKHADERIPDLLATPAAKRFVSIEPMLGPVDLGKCNGIPVYWEGRDTSTITSFGKPIGERKGVGWVKHSGNMHPWLDLVICGGESGPGARPMHPDWPRSIRDQCATAGVPFMFKQWGEWLPFEYVDMASEEIENEELCDRIFEFENQAMHRVGKRRAGRLLDGVEHNGKAV